jgi:hypothetical protein
MPGIRGKRKKRVVDARFVVPTCVTDGRKEDEQWGVGATTVAERLGFVHPEFVSSHRERGEWRRSGGGPREAVHAPLGSEKERGCTRCGL